MNCKNCGNILTSQSNYCNVCGGKVIRNRLTIKNLFQDFSEQYFNYDNKFVQTFICLFTKPEDVIGSYINKTRKKYVSVISYFTLAITIAGIEYLILKKFFPNFIDFTAISAEGMESFTNDVVNFVQEYQSFVLMAFVPVYALMGKIVFFNVKTYNYTEHLVIFMYIISQFEIFSAIISIFSATFHLNMGLISPFLLASQILFAAYCLKRLYKLSFNGIFLRTLFFLIVLVVMYILSIIIVFGLIFTIKGPEFFKEMVEQSTKQSG